MSIFKNWFTLQIELNLAVLRLAEGKKKKHKRWKNESCKVESWRNNEGFQNVRIERYYLCIYKKEKKKKMLSLSVLIAITSCLSKMFVITSFLSFILYHLL